MSARDVPLRVARDRVVDLLGIGDSYPLADLDVGTDQLKVAYGATARVPIEMAQAGVSYELVDPNKGPLGAKYAGDGADGRLTIETPKVGENVTYRVRMRKSAAPPPLDLQPYRFLARSAPVEVGIDATLAVEMVDAPLLDPSNPAPGPSAPRIVPFGTVVGVRVKSTQEGVRYSLIIDGTPQDASSMGNLDDVVLSTPPAREDAVIQVLATKTFRASEKRPTDTQILDATLYLKVMADPAAALSVDSPIVDNQGIATVKVGGTQASARYRLHLRAIPDADFVRGAAPGPALVATAQPGLQARGPERPAAWRPPAGYAPVGDAPTPGTGGDVTIPTPPLVADSMLLVEAIKEHGVGPESGSPVITSSVLLAGAVVVLTRPDATRALTVRVPLGTTRIITGLVLSGGQPGVFYSFQAQGAEQARPAYFHQRDAADPTRNKGIGQLAVEVDLAIPEATTGGDLSASYPVAPSIDLQPLPLGRSFAVRAVKAQTGVGVDMAWSPLAIPEVPAIRPDPDLVPAGKPTKISIPGSDPLDRYQVTLNGAPVGVALAGNGKDRAITTDPITADTVFEVVVARGEEGSVRVERTIRTAVSAGPAAG